MSSLLDVDRVGLSGRVTSVSLHLTTHSCTMVVGDNGTGKSSLLSICAGLLTPSTGSVTVQGRRADRRDPVFRDLVAQSVTTLPVESHLTVREHLDLVSATFSAPAPRACSPLAEALAGVNDAYPDELSAGQFQLFVLLLVLSRPASLFLLDEPERHLSAASLDLLVSVLEELRGAGAGLLVATHSTTLHDSLANDTIRMVAQ